MLAAAPASVSAAPPSVTADHLAIHVKSLDASMRFYADILGLQPFSAKVPPNIVWLKVGDSNCIWLAGARSPCGRLAKCISPSGSPISRL